MKHYKMLTIGKLIQYRVKPSNKLMFHKMKQVKGCHFMYFFYQKNVILSTQIHDK